MMFKHPMPCVCGSMPSTIKRTNCETGSTTFQVICEQCEMEAEQKATQCEAVTEWNRKVSEEVKRGGNF